MKRLMLLAPLALVVAACGTTAPSAKTALSHGARLDGVPLQLDVAGIHRVGGAAALDLRLANRGAGDGDGYSIGTTFSGDGSYDVGGLLLFDQRTGRELTPLRPDAVDVGSMQIAPGGTQTIRTVFPAPHGDRVDVLVPHFGLFRNVPVR